jgi:hypothetical protein
LTAVNVSVERDGFHPYVAFVGQKPSAVGPKTADPPVAAACIVVSG